MTVKTSVVSTPGLGIFSWCFSAKTPIRSLGSQPIEIAIQIETKDLDDFWEEISRMVGIAHPTYYCYENPHYPYLQGSGDSEFTDLNQPCFDETQLIETVEINKGNTYPFGQGSMLTTYVPGLQSALTGTA